MPATHHLRLLFSCLSILMVLSGCAGLVAGNRGQNFDLQMLGYERAIRWGEFQMADSFRLPTTGDPQTDFSAYEGIRVTAYEVLRTTFSDNAEKAQRTVSIQYFRESSPAVRKITDNQEWEYNADLERWFLLTALPQFR